MNLRHLPEQFRALTLVALSALILALVGNISKAHAFSLTDDPALLEKQRQLFLQAEKYINKGQISKYRKIQHELKDYPLYPYLHFAELKRKLKNIPNKDIQDFLLTYHQTPLANKLYYRWIQALAQKGDSNSLVQYFRPSKNTKLLCHYADALYETNKKGAALTLMGELWGNT